MKRFLSLLIFLFSIGSLMAQDAIVIGPGNFLRGLIKGTDYKVVVFEEEGKPEVQFQAKNIESFVWNGETYYSRPMVIKKKVEHRFFKLIEGGSINLFSLGEMKVMEQPVAPKVKVRPTFGIGMGTGGMGGGLGGGITIGGGGGNRSVENSGPAQNSKIFFFIEKPGTGPMLEVNLENLAGIKALLTQKMADDEDLVNRIKSSDQFSEANLIAFVKAYNAGRTRP